METRPKKGHYLIERLLGGMTVGIGALFSQHTVSVFADSVIWVGTLTRDAPSPANQPCDDVLGVSCNCCKCMGGDNRR